MVYMSGGEPPILDYHTPQKATSKLVQVERIFTGIFAAIVTLISAACILAALFTGWVGIFWLGIGLVLMVIAYLLWKAVGIRW